MSMMWVPDSTTFYIEILISITDFMFEMFETDMFAVFFFWPKQYPPKFLQK